MISLFPMAHYPATCDHLFRNHFGKSGHGSQESFNVRNQPHWACHYSVNSCFSQLQCMCSHSYHLLKAKLENFGIFHSLYTFHFISYWELLNMVPSSLQTWETPNPHPQENLLVFILSQLGSVSLHGGMERTHHKSLYSTVTLLKAFDIFSMHFIQIQLTTYYALKCDTKMPSELQFSSVSQLC